MTIEPFPMPRRVPMPILHSRPKFASVVLRPWIVFVYVFRGETKKKQKQMMMMMMMLMMLMIMMKMMKMMKMMIMMIMMMMTNSTSPTRASWYIPLKSSSTTNGESALL